MVVLLLCAALWNCSYLLAPVIGPRLPADVSFVSELSADDQDGSWFFQISDLFTGVLYIVVALGTRRYFPSAVLTRLAQGALVLLGLCTLIDSRMPLDCVSTIDAGCRYLEATEQVSFEHVAHTANGTIETLCATVVLLGFGWSLRHRGRWARFGRLSLVCGVPYAVLSLILALQYVLAIPGVGVSQRVSIVVFSAFLVIFAASLPGFGSVEQVSPATDVAGPR
ncbi:MAG: DUF998 domain-containing protein [Actinomycetes bacterium]